MANYSALKAAIAAAIKQNGNNEITGALLQQELLAMVDSLGVGYNFIERATPNTNPGTPDQRVYYMAATPGTYSNFDGAELGKDDVAIFYYNTQWNHFVTNIATRDSVKNIHRPYLFASSKFIDTLAISGEVGPYYFLENIQKGIRGKILYGISVFIKSRGVFSVAIGKNVGQPNYTYRVLETFNVVVGRQDLVFSTPLVLAEDEWIGFGNNTDTAHFGFATQNFGGNFIHLSGEQWLQTTYDLQIGLFGKDVEFINSLLNNVPEIDDTESDFAIKDESGHSIVVFRGGDIKTKNFDSKTLGGLFLSKFEGKKIGIIGDSISTFAGWLPSNIPGYDGQTYATYYPAGDVNSVTKTWWYKMAVALGLNPSTDISNCAWSGSRVSGNSESTTNAYAGCSTRRISDLLLRGFTPDIIICYISCNDWGNSPNVPIGTWAVTDPIPAEGNKTTLRDAYALMINKLQVAYPNARVFCCTNLDDVARDQTPGWPSNNALGVSTYEWNQNIIEIAHALGCDVIDLNHCGINYANITQFAVDSGLHPNDAGHTLMARKVVAELYAKY